MFTRGVRPVEDHYPAECADEDRDETLDNEDPSPAVLALAVSVWSLCWSHKITAYLATHTIHLSDRSCEQTAE